VKIIKNNSGSDAPKIADLNDTLTTNPTNYLIGKMMFKTRNELFEDKPRFEALEELIKQNPRISYEIIKLQIMHWSCGQRH